ncbi:MAG: hypothetical protein HQL30_12550, partial [Candidatus Omnitrophica bacterium]|nr:hypothetical protein [Candidatus Omnitrophota bacterium]
MLLFIKSNLNLLICKIQRKRLTLRALSFLLVVAFLSQDVSFAAEELKSFLSPSPLSFNIPGSIAITHEGFTPKDVEDPKHIVLIEDAHLNESAQRNIQKILEVVLKDSEIEHVFLEGGWG